MPVYMIQAGGSTGPVKIGHGDEQRRLTDCQVGNHLELKIIRVFEGGGPEEKMLHDRFDDLWIRGEWHNFTRAMLGDLGLVEIVAGAPATSPSAVDSIVKRFGGQSALARILKTSQGTVWEWVEKGRVPSTRIPAIIDAAKQLSPPVSLQPNDFFVSEAAQ